IVSRLGVIACSGDDRAIRAQDRCADDAADGWEDLLLLAGEDHADDVGGRLTGNEGLTSAVELVERHDWLEGAAQRSGVVVPQRGDGDDLAIMAFALFGDGTAELFTVAIDRQMRRCGDYLDLLSDADVFALDHFEHGLREGRIILGRLPFRR